MNNLTQFHPDPREESSSVTAAGDHGNFGAQPHRRHRKQVSPNEKAFVFDPAKTNLISVIPGS